MGQQDSSRGRTHVLTGMRRAWLLGGAVALSGACAFAGLGMSSTMAHAEVARAFSSGQETSGVIVTLDSSASSAAVEKHEVDDESGQFLDETGSVIGSDNGTDGTGAKISLTGLSDGKVRTDVDTDVSVDVTSATRTNDGTVVATVQSSDGKSDEELAQSLVGMPGIKYVEPNYKVSLASLGDKDAASETSITTAAMPNDPLVSVYDSTSTTTGNQWYLKSANVTGAWSDGYATNGKVTVAVIDNGTVLTHPDLKDNLDLDNAYDAGNGQSLQDTFKEYGFYSSDPGGMPEHGTHVTGIVSATAGNSLGIAGVSYNAKVLPIKVTEDKKNASGKVTTTMYVADVIKGLTYLFGAIDSGKVQNCRVVNVSISWYDDEVKSAHDAFATAKNKYGLTVVAAGGNGDDNLNARTDASYPSDYDECISVTSLEPDGTNSKWSDYNMAKDISAPGSLIWSTVLDTANVDSGKNAMGLDTGTSMAAPIVSGIAAMMYATAPKATTQDVYDAIKSTAKKVSTAKNDHTGKTGSAGEIDAAAAIKAIEKKYATSTGTNANAGNTNANAGANVNSSTNTNTGGTNGNAGKNQNGNSNGSTNTGKNTNSNSGTNSNAGGSTNGTTDDGSNGTVKKHSLDELKDIKLMLDDSELTDFSYDKYDYNLTVANPGSTKIEVVGLPSGWTQSIFSGAIIDPSTGQHSEGSKVLTLRAEDGTTAEYRFLFTAATQDAGNGTDDASNTTTGTQNANENAQTTTTAGTNGDGTLVQTGDGMGAALVTGAVAGLVSLTAAIIMRRVRR